MDRPPGHLTPSPAGAIHVDRLTYRALTRPGPISKRLARSSAIAVTASPMRPSAHASSASSNRMRTTSMRSTASGSSGAGDSSVPRKATPAPARWTGSRTSRPARASAPQRRLLLARLALRARQGVLTVVAAALDHFEHDRVDREARLAREQHVLAVDEHDRARGWGHDDAVLAGGPVGMHDVVRLEPQPSVLVHDSPRAAHVTGIAHVGAAPSPVYRNSAMPSGSITGSISSGFDFQKP